MTHPETGQKALSTGWGKLFLDASPKIRQFEMKAYGQTGNRGAFHNFRAGWGLECELMVLDRGHWDRWTHCDHLHFPTLAGCLRPGLLLLLGALRYPSSFNKHTLLRHLLLLFGLLQEGFRQLMGLRLQCVHACASEKGRGACWERVEEFLHPFSMQVCYPHLKKINFNSL